MSYLFLRYLPWVSIRLFSLYRHFALLNHDNQAARDCGYLSKKSTSATFDPSSSLLIIVPSERFHDASWKTGGGNYFYEIFESALENLPISKIDYYIFSNEINIYDDFRKLADFIVNGGYTHCLASTESDPGCATSWNWDFFAMNLQNLWEGMFLGLATDSVYLLQQLRFSHLNKIYDRSILIGIDVKPCYLYLSSHNYFGPVFLPISSKSINRIDDELANCDPVEKKFDVVFSGKIYPYRVRALRKLSRHNLNIGINPHLKVESNGSESTYLGYIKALQTGRFTLNFARAGGINKQQLKSRVLESSLFGVPVLSDESDLSGIFFNLNGHFLFFKITEDFYNLNIFLQDNDSYLRLARESQIEARSIASSSFWDVVNKSFLAYSLKL